MMWGTFLKCIGEYLGLFRDPKIWMQSRDSGVGYGYPQLDSFRV